MTHPPTGPTGLVPDANVLIDYAESDKEILSLVAKHVAPVYVPSPVLAEVRQLTYREVSRLGIRVVEPTSDQATEALKEFARTSYEDRLCLIVARDNAWTCVTNDRALRKAFQQAGLACMWGLEIMGMLARSGHLPRKRAAATAERIATNNPYITPGVLGRFKKQIGV